MEKQKEEFVGILQGSKQNGTVVKQEGQKLQQFICAIIASIGALIIGCVLAWTSPCLTLLEGTNYSTPFKVLDDSENAWISAWTPIGAIFGALAAGIFTSILGRKLTLIVFTVPWIGTWILTNLAPSIYFLYLARFISGIVVGLFCAALPMYVNEIAEDSIRGTLGTMFQLFLTLGILLDYILGVFKSYALINYSITGVTILFLILLFYIPESPTFLMVKNHRNDAEASLKKLRGCHYNVDAELNNLRQNLNAASQQRFSFGLLFKKANFMALIISIGLMLAQQFSGINAVIFFAQGIFEAAGATNPELCTIIVGIVQTVATLVSAILVDRAGRKILLLISSISMGLCLLVLGWYFWMKDGQRDVSSIGLVPLLSVVFLIIGFSLGLGPLPWMMSGEVLAPEVKSFGTGASVTVNWICVSLVTFFFEPFKNLIGTAFTFWLFAIVCALSSVYILVIIPETKGKSIQEVQNILAGRKHSTTTNGKV